MLYILRARVRTHARTHTHTQTRFQEIHNIFIRYQINFYIVVILINYHIVFLYSKFILSHISTGIILLNHSFP